MKEKREKPYYGYRINKYIAVVLIGGGIVGITLAIIFTILMYSTWVLSLCWVFGAVLLIWGVFWRLSVGFVTNPQTIKSFQDNFADQLRTVWNGKGKVLDIGTGLGRAAVEIARQFPEARAVGVDTWTKNGDSGE